MNLVRSLLRKAGVGRIVVVVASGVLAVALPSLSDASAEHGAVRHGVPKVDGRGPVRLGRAASSR